MFCDKYKKNCEEAMKYNCTVPSNEIEIDKQIQECEDCIFCNKLKEKWR